MAAMFRVLQPRRLVNARFLSTEYYVPPIPDKIAGHELLREAVHRLHTTKPQKWTILKLSKCFRMSHSMVEKMVKEREREKKLLSVNKHFDYPWIREMSKRMSFSDFEYFAVSTEVKLWYGRTSRGPKFSMTEQERKRRNDIYEKLFTFKPDFKADDKYITEWHDQVIGDRKPLKKNPESGKLLGEVKYPRHTIRVLHV